MRKWFRKTFGGEKEFKILAVATWSGEGKEQKVFDNFSELGEVMKWFKDQGGYEGGELHLELTE